MKIKVSELIVKYLEKLGIDTIFGMPGAHILPVYDSLYDSAIQSVLVKHEQGAAFMAGGYAKAAGRISACITTAGPGATNLTTGIANAYADNLPVLVITGETPTQLFGKGGLQESSGEGGSIDQSSLFQGITRYNKIVERTDYLAQVLNRATKMLLSATPGPVLLSFPYNVQKEEVDDSLLDEIKVNHASARSYHNQTDTQTLFQHLSAAKKPVIIAGFGCIVANAQDEVSSLSNLLNVAVTTSLKGKGVIDEKSRHSLGSLGVTSNGHAQRYILEQADLLLFLGAGFNERTSYLWNKDLLADKTIIQIDNNPEQLEKVFSADQAIQGDIKQVLSDLLGYAKTQPEVINNSTIHQYTEKMHDEDCAVSPSRFPLVHGFFKRLSNHFPDELFVFDDNIIFAQNFFHASNKNRYFSNSGISSLGHAIPAAIGARFWANNPTFAVIGDGGFQMCCMELMTAVNYDIPINVVMLNNSTMGLIRKNQFQQYDERYIDCDFINPDYQALALSFGIGYKKIESDADLDTLFSDFDLVNKVNLIDLMIDKNAFPNYSSRR